MLLLWEQDGRLFHIDFGYIMGREPKPFAPPVKLCREMVEAMGGTESDAYIEFQTYCCEAYNILRKSAPLVLNLVALMSKSNIPDIAAAPEKVLLKLESKFQLDCDDEEAGEHLKARVACPVNPFCSVCFRTSELRAAVLVWRRRKWLNPSGPSSPSSWKLHTEWPNTGDDRRLRTSLLSGRLWGEVHCTFAIAENMRKERNGKKEPKGKGAKLSTQGEYQEGVRRWRGTEGEDQEWDKPRVALMKPSGSAKALTSGVLGAGMSAEPVSWSLPSKEARRK